MSAKKGSSILGNVPKLSKNVIKNNPAPEIDEKNANDFIKRAPVEIKKNVEVKAVQSPRKVCSFNLSEDVIKKLNVFCSKYYLSKSKKITKSDVLEDALNEYFLNHSLN